MEQNNEPIKFIRSMSAAAEVLTGFKKSARAELAATGLLTDTIPIGGKARGYLQHELELVAEARARGLDDDAVREVVRALKTARGLSTVFETRTTIRDLIARLAS